MDKQNPCDAGQSSLTPIYLQIFGLVVALVGPIIPKILDRYWSKRLTPPKEKQ
jgi:hypothetical protein